MHAVIDFPCFSTTHIRYFEYYYFMSIILRIFSTRSQNRIDSNNGSQFKIITRNNNI